MGRCLMLPPPSPPLHKIWKSLITGALGTVLLLLPVCTASHREHKVHNIVLYPDKHSWCTTLAIKQVISYPGCKSEEIDNNVCVGACFSYSIPHTEPSDPGEVIVPYCDSCQPSETAWHNVALTCVDEQQQPNKLAADATMTSSTLPPQSLTTLVKRVQIITNCSCSSCDKIAVAAAGSKTKRRKHHDDELFAEQLQPTYSNEQPDLLNVLQQRYQHHQLHRNASSAWSAEYKENVKKLMNHKIIGLLKNIQEKNALQDKMQLIELLRMVHHDEYEPNNERLNGSGGASGAAIGIKAADDKMITDFVDSLSVDEHIELDVPKLKEILKKFENSRFYDEKLLQIHEDDEDMTNGAPYDDNINYSIEDDAVQDNLATAAHNINLLSESANLPDHQDNINSNLKKINDYNSGHYKDHPHHHHHHHHAGEVFGHGHLVKGPRGALIVEPASSTIASAVSTDYNDFGEHKTLHIPDPMKPNHADGTVFSYGKRQHLDGGLAAATLPSDDAKNRLN